MEWNRIISGMKDLGIYQSESQDKILSTRKMAADNITMAHTYSTLCNLDARQGEHQVLYAFWKTKIPSKIIIFTWLVYHNKNLIGRIWRKYNGMVLACAPYAKVMPEIIIIFFSIVRILYRYGNNYQLSLVFLIYNMISLRTL